jgi:hypothetical protein
MAKSMALRNVQMYKGKAAPKKKESKKVVKKAK